MSGYRPGVSVFHKGRDGESIRVSKDAFGPGDLYCGVWHLFDLPPDGPGGLGSTAGLFFTKRLKGFSHQKRSSVLLT